MRNDNSLIPAPRRPSNADVVPDEPVEATIEQRSEGHVSDGQVPIDDWEEETKSLLLSLPAPMEKLTPWTMVTAQLPPIPRSTVLLTRSIKSGIVITKVGGRHAPTESCAKY
jgi:hypothetical protein